jgi:hypothetical protein
MHDITWSTQKRDLKDLKDHSKNPRRISKSQMHQLKKSLSKFNYCELAAINLDNTILAGHMRIKALKSLKKKTPIEVRVPSRLLSAEEAEEYLIRSNKNIGEWDFDMLANEFEVENLIDWGFLSTELGIEKENSTANLDEEITFSSKILLEVECESQEKQKSLFEEFSERGLICRILNL